MTQPVEKIEDIPQFASVGSLKRFLTINGCKMCSLGFQPEINGVCVSRGPETANKMIVGEAPGKEEDSSGKPFSGPAGHLMDEIWASVGMNTNDWYCTNINLCRPYMPRGSGKENYTPKVEQRKKCRVFLDKQIELIKPKIIVTLGAVATSAILNNDKPIKMGDYRGKLIQNCFVKYDNNDGTVTLGRPFIFPILHPAAILHAKGNQELYDTYRQQMWDDIRSLKKVLEQEKI